MQVVHLISTFELCLNEPSSSSASLQQHCRSVVTSDSKFAEPACPARKPESWLEVTLVFFSAAAAVDVDVQWRH